MYTLLIVDDEPLVQVGIKSMLNWAELNIQICGIAMNGRTALEMIEQQSPDIVITDIKMPIMSGLELIRTCSERYGEEAPEFIILTSYEDFYMAKEAVKYQVADYLVKLELNAETLSAAVQRILDRKERLKPENSGHTSDSGLGSYYDKYFIKLLNNLFENEEQEEIQRKNLGINLECDRYNCAHVEIISNIGDNLPVEKQAKLFTATLQMFCELIVKYLPSHIISLDLHHCALLFLLREDAKQDSLTDVIETVTATLKKYYNVDFRIGIGIPAETKGDISESYQAARRAFSDTTEQCPMVSAEQIDSNAGRNIFNISIFRDELGRAFEEFNEDSLNKTLTEITELFRAHPSHYLQALDGACNILYLAISLIPNGETILSEFFKEDQDSYRSIYRKNNMAQIIDWLTVFRDSLCAYFRERNKDHKNHIVVQVKKYITAHIRERLTLNDAANSYSISPNYLSQLFRKYNDMGFNEYVTYLKIEEAKKLLSEGTYKVYEVADMLGFESAFYFSKVFKKVEGISPTDHQNNKAGNDEVPT